MASTNDQYPVFEKGSPSAQYQQISNFCVNYLEGLLVNLMHMELPDPMHAELDVYQAIQQKLLNRERTVRHAFQFQIEKRFSEFKSIRRTRLHSSRSSDWLSFGLAGHNSSKLQQHIENITDKYERRFDRQLLTHAKRLKTLVHRTDDAQDDNPLSPVSLCNAFVASIEALNLTTNKTCQLFELLDWVLENQLHDFYIQIDLGLYYLDILPELTDPKLFNEPVETDSPGCQKDELSEEEEAQEQALLLFVNCQLKNRKKLVTKKDQAREQAKQHLFSLREATLSGTLEYAREFESFLQNIDGLMVGNQCAEILKFTQFYTRLLDNPLLSKPLKLQLSRLSYPLLEMVLKDPFFFRSSSHPVNDFIQSIIDFEIRYQHQQESLATLESILDDLLEIDKPVLSDFLPFILQYEDFKSAQIEHIKQLKEIADEALKKNLLEQVNDMTRSLVVSSETLAFFYDDWQLLLLQLARKIGHDSNEFNQAIEIARMLAWSLDENRDTSNKRYKKQSFTQLLKAIDKGLNAVNFSSEHRHRVRKQLVKDFKENNESTQVTIFDSQATRPSDSISQFSTTIINRTSQLSDIKIRSTMVKPNTENTIAAQDMEMGTWVEITLDKYQKPKRAKLKWKSADNNQFVFVDQRGHKIKQSCQEELDEDLSNGTVKLLKAPSSSARSHSTLGGGFHCFAN